jgi:hypothetical protein
MMGQDPADHLLLAGRQVDLSRGQQSMSEDELDIGERQRRVLGHPVGSGVPQRVQRCRTCRGLTGSFEYAVHRMISKRLRPYPPAAPRHHGQVTSLDRPDRAIQVFDLPQPIDQLGDRGHPRHRRQRRIRRADTQRLTANPADITEPAHPIGALSPEMIMHSQSLSSQVRPAPIAISDPVSPPYSRIRVSSDACG